MTAEEQRIEQALDEIEKMPATEFEAMCDWFEQRQTDMQADLTGWTWEAVQKVHKARQTK